jgi:polysaccharide deacetylase 2 family uncharacterized protein YibQ
VLDDLSAPLGQGRKKRAAELPVALPKIIAGVLGGFLVLFVGWTMFADVPFGGEPMVVAPANLRADTTGPNNVSADPGARTAAKGAGRPNRYDGPDGAAPDATVPSPVNSTVTIIDGTNGKREDVVVPGQAPDKLAAIDQHTDPRLAEPSRNGPIPRIAQDGTRPAEAFAQPVKPMPDKPNAPQVAIVVAGLGISAAATSEALAKLPGPVTLAFAPYGADLDRLGARARDGGHELLLQVPMEPPDYPDSDPGPQALLTSLDASKNVERLHWLMSRMQGYVGIANYMGGRFTASDQALAPILRETAKRGLIYVEDGSSPRSIAGQIAGANNLPYAKADIIIDAVPTGAEIDRALARLERTARERGIAVGFANAMPASIEHIANWAKTAESHGILLVPITAMAARAKSS